jgi:hypothetical protein
VATPQTRHFPLKEQDVRYLFFFHNSRELFVGRRDVGCDSGFWCDFFFFAGFLTIWWLNIMNFTTVLCKHLIVKELVTNVPVYESITGNACSLPEHCFVCIDFLWVCVVWCYGVFVIMKALLVMSVPFQNIFLFVSSSLNLGQ